jgi:hypothetical protein
MSVYSFPLIYFGPITQQPSWYWVGQDIANYMSLTLDVRYFRSIDDIKDGSLVYWIKCPLAADGVERIRRKRLTVVFLPVDVFQSEDDIVAHQDFINQANLICLHAQSLRPCFKKSNIASVEHYNKYGVRYQDRCSDRKTLLWIGAFQYVPYVLDGLRSIAWSSKDIKLITNLHHPPARAAAEHNAERVGLNDYMRCLTSSSLSVIPWSESNQKSALLSCSAAFDIKYLDCFNQFHKPPTKMQKYLASGIPCAINPDFRGVEKLVGTSSFETLDRDKNDPIFLRNVEKKSTEFCDLLSIKSVADTYFELAQQIL